MFNTFTNKELVRVEHGDDVEYAYGLARAHNRAMVDFCSVDRRLLAVGYVPLVDFEQARATAAGATSRRDGRRRGKGIRTRASSVATTPAAPAAHAQAAALPCSHSAAAMAAAQPASAT